MSAENLEKLVAARAKIQETYGKVVMALSATPRYRHLSIGDLTSILLDPLIRDRVSIAQAMKDGTAADMLGIAIWASVSDDADARIREQIREGVFPVRLKPDDWTSGPHNWLLDLIAPTPQLASLVLANFKQVVKNGKLNVHPHVAKRVDRKVLSDLGVGSANAAEEASSGN